MSDKSFGDHTNRNILKNPLLSSAVTGLSLEDLTHNAVLLPVVQSEELIRRQDQQTGPQVGTLAHNEYGVTNLPSGDANSNTTFPTLPPTINPNTLDSKQNDKYKGSSAMSNLSKASQKSEDDFDVNEYFARLQGSRYVSAPLNSLLKEDKNANLEATEENLEEINLNEPEKVQNADIQQSLTADIAQNFSQLPTVLPQMASAVFSSFSNMLSMKSREQTPDEVKPDSGYQEVQFQRPEDIGVPLMGVDERVQEVAPPPKEPPISGTTNYRITTKKKAYAQIPGLSSRENTQNLPLHPPMNHSSIPPFFTPLTSTNVLNEGSGLETDPIRPKEVNLFNPVHTETNNEGTATVHSVVNYNEPNLYANKVDENFGTIEYPSNQTVPFYGQDAQTAAIAQPTPPIIPPPPMFSNAPRKDNNTVGKSVLPPSVARRISANHPIIKPTMSQAPVFASNIFVPNLDPSTTDNLQNLFNSGHSQSQNIVSTVFTPTLVTKSQPTICNVPATPLVAPAVTQASAVLQNQSDSQSLAISSASAPNVPSDSFNLQSSTWNITAPPTNVLNSTTSIHRSSFIQENSADVVNLPPSSTIFFNPGPSNSLPPINVFTPTSAFNPQKTLSSSAEVPLPASTTPSYPGEDLLQSSTPTTESTTTNICQNSASNNVLALDQNTSNLIKSIPLNTQDNILQPSSFAQNVPLAPSFFNPSTVKTAENDLIQSNQENVKHIIPPPVADIHKSIAEPPKASGNINYRLNKKRPQYYAGPIEGVGSISNNIKPLLPTVEPSSFQGDLFVPQQPSLAPIEQELVAPNIEQATVPFDLNKQENTMYSQFNVPNTQKFAPPNVQSDYNTAFDLSRPTTEKYQEPPQESKGFGIIGSLKSKLSSIDINKIQNTVTTFFDPAYNEAKKEETFNQENISHGHQSNAQASYGYNNQEFEIFVPNEQLPIPTQNYNYQNSQNMSNYFDHMQYYPVQDSCNYYQNQEQTNYYTNLQQNYVTNYDKDPHTSTIVSTAEAPVKDNLHNAYFNDTNTTSFESIDKQPIGSVTLHEKSEYIPNANVPEQEIAQNPSKNDISLSAQNFFSFIPPTTQESSLYKTSDSQQSVNSTVYENKPENVLNVTAHQFFDNKLPVTEETVTKENVEPPLQETSQTEVKDENILPPANFFSYDSTSKNSNDDVLEITNIQTTVNTSVRYNNSTEQVEEKNDILAKEALLLSAKNHIQIPENTFSNFRFDIDNKDKDQFPIIQNNQTINQENVTDNAEIEAPVEYSTNNISDKSLETTELEFALKNVSLNEIPKNMETVSNRDTSISSCENITCRDKPLRGNSQENDSVSDFNICETCREVNKPEGKETDDLTSQMIENIIAPIQLLNPVEVPFTESNTPVDDRIDFDTEQCVEISNITEETIEALQVQSAAKLLDNESGDNISTRGYGWCTDNTMPTSKDLIEHNYAFQMDPNSIGFYGGNSLFFDNIPNNASDEIKAEYKNSYEDTPVVLPRQMSVPTAPPAPNNDFKSDETGGLDVHSIEQDAKKDFPLFEEFVIDPSETDDDKIEYKERERSSDDPVPEVDSFTDRVEKFKKMEETAVEENDDIFDAQKSQRIDLITMNNPVITIASYFDTGNYAAETHYRNSISSPYNQFQVGSPNIPMRIPPGFEDEYKRRLSGISSENLFVNTKNEPYIPDTSTQIRPPEIPTYSSIHRPDEELPVTQEKESRKSSCASEKLIPLATIFGDNMAVKQTENFQKIESADSQRLNLSSEILSSEILPPPSTVCGISQEQHLPTLEPKTEESNVKLDTPLFGGTSLSTEIPETSRSFPEIPSQTAEKKQTETKMLPDPVSFFSTPENPVNKQEDNDNSFNRLASYFTTPTNTDPAKSFFELSQSQNHYRHASNESKPSSMENNSFQQSSQSNLDQKHIQNIPHDKSIINLMKDLTSFQHFENDQIVRRVNYFTTEYSNVNINELKIGEPSYSQIVDKEIGNKVTDLENKNDNKSKLEEMTDDECFLSMVMNCKYCCNNWASLDKRYKVRKTMDSGNTESKRESDSNMEQDKPGASHKDVTVIFQNNEERNEDVAVMTEQRSSAEYTPVKHHWFYRVDTEKKSTWKGFSFADSKALEEAFHSPNLNENTLVPTDGGRYDVNIIGRLRVAVYWADKPTNVRRCSWFYKGTTDPRYVPYTEAVAEKLEEEYRHGMTTGEWHRRLVLPNNESVVMHGPTVMVHLLQSATDSFSSTPQTTMRPRVVRRGWDESEIEDMEPSSIDHLLLLCHGVGSTCDMRLRSVVEVVDDFRATSLQLLQSHYRNSYDNGVVNRVEVLPISWHATLHAGEAGVDRRVAQITLDSIPKLRNFTNDTVLDILFYTSPIFCQTIIDTVCAEMNRIYRLFVSRNPHFRGTVSLGGHSLGSVILYDLLCHQRPNDSDPSEKHYVSGTAGTGQAAVRYPRLEFSPAALYALGSPIAIFECIRGVESLGADFVLPTCKHFFNIFHPYDPIAYRIEPLINPQLKSMKPYLIPHHKGRKRMHLELKETMARVGADLKQKLLESLKTTWSSVWRTQPPPSDCQLEKVVEEEIEKEQLCEENKDDVSQDIDLEAPDVLGKLNSGRRIDYVLQEAPFEMINEYLFAMSSHVCYWESEDTMLMILREIYSSMGVQTDGSLPQQSLTVQRTRLQREEEALSLSTTDHPSTSRGDTYRKCSS